MTDREQSIYITIRSEHICFFQLQNYPDFYKDRMPKAEDFREFAERELMKGIKDGNIIISLDDLLTLDPQECNTLISNRGGQNGPICMSINEISVDAENKGIIILTKPGSGKSAIQFLHDTYGSLGAEIILKKNANGEDISSYLIGF